MPAVHWDVTAQADLGHIWDYLARESGDSRVANRLIESIRHKSEVYANQPEMGTRHEEFGTTTRSFRVGSYLGVLCPV